MRHRVGIFAYDFEHWKTQAGILNLVFNDFKPAAILGAPWEELSVEKSSIRIAPKGQHLLHPRKIAEVLNILYYTVGHNSEQAANIIRAHNLDLGIILGARILKNEIIEAFKYGIINLHPGLLPENRGLDNIKWAIMTGMDNGASLHFIDHRVDMGRLVDQETIPIFQDDTLMDLHIRVQGLEQKLMINAVRGFENRGIYISQYKELDKGHYFKAMPADVERTLQAKFVYYKRERAA
jgi:phosphoribosylglycinamide formyltransferase-1